MSTLYLEIFSYEENANVVSIRCPLESLIILAVRNYCIESIIDIKFVIKTSTDDGGISIQISNESFFVISFSSVPWQVKSCKLPVVQNNDTVISGLCATARHICTLRNISPQSQEHPDGLLGFRGNCLQAPNVVSVWTKFCEVDMLDSVKRVCSKNYDSINLAINAVKRFEVHLSQPLRVHNVYKLLSDKKKEFLKENKDEKDSDSLDKCKKGRICKARKWKSNTKPDIRVNCEDLKSDHKFAEGPFLTLADLILYPLVNIWIEFAGVEVFEKHFSLTLNWHRDISTLDRINSVKTILASASFEKASIDMAIFNSVPEIKEESLYKCDPKRANPTKRLFTKEEDIESALKCLDINQQLQIEPNDMTKGLDWSTIPDGANPFAGHLPDKRMRRKTQQLENLALAVVNLAKDGDRIVDFCCGSGHLGILLAHLLPNCLVILLENKERSLLRARTRVHGMGLSNVHFFHANLDFYDGPFEIGVALHACGVATDLVIEKCVAAKATFAVCPCCYGSLHETARLEYPRSGAFACVPVARYMCIGHAADQTHEGHPMHDRGVKCMQIIDSDRANYAIERNYRVRLSRLKPLTCTPKNMLLIGVYK